MSDLIDPNEGGLLTRCLIRYAGMYTSTKDLSSLGRAILDGTLLKPVQLRRWLKPHTHTSSLDQSIGAPWEISRVNGLTRDGRVIDIYGKAGDLQGYNSILALIPDYEIMMTVMVAGPSPAVRDNLVAEILSTMLPAIDEAGREQASRRFAGTYSSTDSTNSTFSLNVDDGPGLNVVHWVSRGVDQLVAEPEVTAAGAAGTTFLRLYPTGLRSKREDTSGNCTTLYEMSFRSKQDIIPAAQNGTAESECLNGGSKFGSGGASCNFWSKPDAYRLAGRALDEFVFQIGNDEKAISVEARGYQAVYRRT